MLAKELSIIARYSDPKRSPFNLVRLSPGQVAATNGNAGCSVPSSVTVEAAVPLRDFRRAVATLKDPDIVLKRSTLHAKDKATSFKFKTVPQSTLFPLPTAPTTGMTPLAGSIVSVLSALSGISDQDASVGGGTLDAIRLTPDWVAVATHGYLMAASGWDDPIVSERVSVVPDSFVGLDKTVSIGFDDNKIWIVDDETDQVRWANVLATAWPDSVIEDTLEVVKARTGRDVVVDVSEFTNLIDQALVLMEGEEFAALTVADECLELSGDFKHGKFDGAISATDETVARVGVNPAHLKRILKVVQSDTLTLSFAEQNDPILVKAEWAGIELAGMVMPVYLSK